MILPGMGIISEVMACFCRKRVFGYTAVAFSSVSIAVFSFFVWAHHMFIMGISNYSALVFSIMSMLVAVPSAIKVFNWSATMYKGSISFDTPMLYTLGFIGLFTMGGCTGIMLAALGLNIQVTETYFIVAHFHYIMVGGMVSAYMAGLHFWWPKITGRKYPEQLGKVGSFHPVYWLQPHLFPTVRPRLSWDAPTLSCLSAGVSGAKRPLYGRRLHSSRRLFAASSLSCLVT